MRTKYEECTIVRTDEDDNETELTVTYYKDGEYHQATRETPEERPDFIVWKAVDPSGKEVELTRKEEDEVQKIGEENDSWHDDY